MQNPHYWDNKFGEVMLSIEWWHLVNVNKLADVDKALHHRSLWLVLSCFLSHWADSLWTDMDISQHVVENDCEWWNCKSVGLPQQDHRASDGRDRTRQPAVSYAKGQCWTFFKLTCTFCSFILDFCFGSLLKMLKSF